MAPRPAFLTLLLIAVAEAMTAAAAGQAPTSLQFDKRITVVRGDGWTQVTVVIVNNSSLPIFELEVQEFYNHQFALGGNLTLFYRNATLLLPLSSGPIANPAQAQFLMVLPAPGVLLPGEQLRYAYWQRAPSTGDFLVPRSLTWFMYEVGASRNRALAYSNGYLVHVPHAYEQAVAATIPYVVGAMTFIVTIGVLLYLRRYVSIRRRALTFR